MKIFFLFPILRSRNFIDFKFRRFLIALTVVEISDCEPYLLIHTAILHQVINDIFPCIP
jgi:hypothetical protein